MAKTLYYLFDPLCGWCYGATPAMARLRETVDVSLEMLPTGLFSGAGARPMDDDFAAYAWNNDQRIERLTGQQFTERYRTQVLGDHQRRFDSAPATMALTAVALTEPARELDALKVIQQARYVDGQDVTSLETLAGLLLSLKLEAAADRLASSDRALLDAVNARTSRAQALMQNLGARGVPSLIAGQGQDARLVNSAALYGGADELIAGLRDANIATQL